MIINYFNFRSITGIPFENDAPLVVDADGMKPRQLAFEQLQPVPGWHLEIVQGVRVIHLDEFSQSHPCDGGKAPVGFRLEQLLRVPI